MVDSTRNQTASTGSQSGRAAAGRPKAGPLVLSTRNPRYFTVQSDEDQQAVYLTGSHIWNNFHDGLGPGHDCVDPPEQNAYNAYLDFLVEHNHNLIRLWRWEHFKSQAAGGSFHLCMTPQPWPRSGSQEDGMAKDGKPKFDLSRFDQAYFDRLRERVIAAGDRGIYVDVMLFDGFAIHLSPTPDNVEGHPFHAANNINGISVTSILDYQVLPLDPRVQELQEAYIRRVVDTVQDLPNVLYEVANESSGGGVVDAIFAQAMGLPSSPDWGDSTEWQYWVINFVKEYERQKGYTNHPIGMTMQYPVADQAKVNEPLFNSPADWISPGYDDQIFVAGTGVHPMMPGSPLSRWADNPPASEGRKVIISDTDHYAPPTSDSALWAWKSFLRGINPILMDFAITDVANPQGAAVGLPPYEASEPARYAMGDTLRYAERMRLVDMEPRNGLSSTGYALANAGEEYLALQPSDKAEPFTVTLERGTYAVEWYSVNSRETEEADDLVVEHVRSIGFTSPFAQAGPTVLYLRRVGR